MRKFFALTLALVFAVLAAVPAFAVDTTDAELDAFLVELADNSQPVEVANKGRFSCQLPPSQVDEECFCLSVYEPVCGCDGQTYSNSCLASCVIKSWTDGECGGGPVAQ